MKKTGSIALLLLVLLIAVHPALALHFCGGNLRSVSLADERETCCCDAGTSDPSAGNFKKGCCSTAVIELSTDQYQSQNLTVRTVPVAFELAISDFSSFRLSNRPCFTDCSDYATPHSPPLREGRQFLVLHCIFRI